MARKRKKPIKVFPIAVENDNLYFTGGAKRQLTDEEEKELRVLLFGRMWKSIGKTCVRLLGKSEFNRLYMTEAKID